MKHLRICSPFDASGRPLGVRALAAAGPVWALFLQSTAHAQDGFTRGEGFYFAWWKLLLFWIVVIMWSAAADWISRDTREIGEEISLSGDVWNPIVVFTFLAAFLVGLFIPIFFVGLAVMILAYAVPVFTYIGQRNGRVVYERRVLTGPHLKTWFANFGKPEKKDVEIKLAHEHGAPVDLESTSGAAEQNQINTIRARQQSEAYLAAKQMIADCLDRRAERLLLDYGANAVAARLEIDGVWHNLDAMDRAAGDQLLVMLKILGGVNENERRMRQAGSFKTVYKNVKYATNLTAQGVKTGERAILEFVGPKASLASLEQLGMRDRMQAQLKELLAASNGMVLFSAPAAGGLRTTWHAGLHATDRLLRDFVCIEDKDQPSEPIENVASEGINVAAGETPDKVLPKLLLKQPEVLVLPELYNAETVKMLCDEVLNENRLVISRVRAKEAVEALLRVLLFKAPADRFAKAVTGVLNQRLLRRLCPGCKQSYEPPPDLLRRLGIPAGKVEVLYREFQPPPPGSEPPKKKGEPEVCQECGGIGYRGRIAVFELLLVDDEIRRLLIKQPKLELLRKAARQAGNRSLQEEGILLVANGVTSITELQRILKQ